MFFSQVIRGTNKTEQQYPEVNIKLLQKQNAPRKTRCANYMRRLPLAGVVGFEPTEYRNQNPGPYHLAIPQSIWRRDHSASFGWDRWIRTIGMTESKSAALPLGYIPISIHHSNSFSGIYFIISNYICQGLLPIF